MVNPCRELRSRCSEIGSHFHHFPAVFLFSAIGTAHTKDHTYTEQPPQRPTKKDLSEQTRSHHLRPVFPLPSLFPLSPPPLLTLSFPLPPHSLSPPLLNPPTSLAPSTPRQTLPVTAQLSQAQLGHNPQYKPHIPNKETKKRIQPPSAQESISTSHIYLSRSRHSLSRETYRRPNGLPIRS